MGRREREQFELIPQAPAEARMEVGNDLSPVTVIGNEAIRETFDASTLRQIANARRSPGVTKTVLTPDAHVGYGAPIGCVMSSPTHIYPGPVGVDVKCSMSLLQFDLPASELEDRELRRALINAICARIPTGAGAGQRSVPKGRRFSNSILRQAIIEGGSEEVCKAMGIPTSWQARCEDAFHAGHDGNLKLEERRKILESRLDRVISENNKYGHGKLIQKFSQIGSYGGGNHFCECEEVRLAHDEKLRDCATSLGLVDGSVAMMSHCGSRGFGNILATQQFKRLERHFEQSNIPFPGNDKKLVYAELGTQLANDYLDDMALGANFATVNHLLINALIIEAFEEVLPGVDSQFIYLISHNIARLEPALWDEDGGDRYEWVHRKGATRAFPAGHPALQGTDFEQTGHPILLPGNPRDGSVVMVARDEAAKTCYSVNHGAGRVLSRGAAFRNLDQKSIDTEMDACDILSNCRRYPRDEAPDAYKDFEQVLASVKEAKLADEVARLHAMFVIKDADKADD